MTGSCLFVCFQWTKWLVLCKGDLAISTVLNVIGLTGVRSFLVIVAACSVELDVVGGSQSDCILVPAKSMLTLLLISPSCSYHHDQDSKAALLFFCFVKSTAHTAGTDTHS